ncbi:MAG: zinc ribbon domain-containing protein [Lachnospiraceae bacterium]|nr:zinc ribbon domain-containing protein [Lachnospiraceae bacterium]
MPRFCKYCGTELMEEASFCMECGRPVIQKLQPSQGVGQQVQQPAQSRQESPAAEVKPAETKQEEAQSADVVKQAAATQAKAAAAKAKEQVKTQAKEQAGSKVKEVISAVTSMDASETAGEVTAGVFGGEAGALAEKAKEAAAIASPFVAVLRGAWGFLKGIPRTFMNKKSMIFAIIMVVIYLVLYLLNRFDVKLSAAKVFSYLTLAESGSKRGVVGEVAGLIGKGTVAAALYSLINGKIKSAWDGIRSLFGKGVYDSKSDVRTLLLGMGFAYLMYSFFTWKAPVALSMAGVAGILLSLETLGSREGYLFSIAQALTAVKKDKVRKERSALLKGLLSGTVFGFTLVTACAVGLGKVGVASKITAWILFGLGAAFVVGGIVAAVFGKKKKGGAVA